MSKSLSKKVITVRKIQKDMSSQDKDALRMLVESYGEKDIRECIRTYSLNEDGESNVAFSPSQPTTMKGAIDDPDDGKRIHSSKGQISIFSGAFWRGLWRNLPSLAVSCAKYGLAGTALKAIGVIHYRNEQKFLSRFISNFNTDRWSDWGSTVNPEKKEKEEKRTASGASSMRNASADKKKDDYSDTGFNTFSIERGQGEDVNTIVKEARKDAVKKIKPMYVRYSNYEIVKVYAYDGNEAMEQANALVIRNGQKYADMRKLTDEGCHTFRIVFDDNTITYVTAEDEGKARTIAQETADSLAKFYTAICTFKIKEPKIKSSTDEGRILLTMPTAIGVIQGVPDPDKFPRLSALKEPEKFTDEQAGTKTYKVRIGMDIIYICADGDDEAFKVAKKLMGIDTVFGFYSSLSKTTKEHILYKYTLDCGDTYLFSEPKEATTNYTADDKMKAVFDAKAKIMKEYGGPKTKAYLESKKFSADDGKTMKYHVENKEKVDIPRKVFLARIYALSLIEGEKEVKQLYQSSANPAKKEEKKQTPAAKPVVQQQQGQGENLQGA